RDNLIPPAERGSGLAVHVGGQTAAGIDVSSVLGSKPPLFVTVVVVLAFILLTAVFRSLLIPLVASVLNLLSVAAAVGAITAVFTKGWGGSLLRLAGTGPVDAFLPVVMFSVLFGLSMDYEVYTVGRMHEEWRRLNRVGPAVLRNHRAVTSGQAQSTPDCGCRGRNHDPGLWLVSARWAPPAAGIRLRARFLRSRRRAAYPNRVAAGRHAPIGPANWLPRWLDRLLPRLDLEADEPLPEEKTITDPAPAR
ncbi:MAG TPA: MMPL family transporter, partial [Mycobacteriales bacterium]|nr:MMPL family transporter [Mycobacteriales bacterium]